MSVKINSRKSQDLMLFLNVSLESYFLTQGFSNRRRYQLGGKFHNIAPYFILFLVFYVFYVAHPKKVFMCDAVAVAASHMSKSTATCTIYWLSLRKQVLLINGLALY